MKMTTLKNKYVPIEKKDFRKITKIIDGLDLDKPIEVKIRKQGKLSNGISGKCHNNVCEVVKHLGGKQVMGYWFCRIEGLPYTRLIHHSVWLSPENKFADITLGNKMFELQTITFFPKITFDPTKDYCEQGYNLVINDNIHKGVLIMEGGKILKIVPMNAFKKVKILKKQGKLNPPDIDEEDTQNQSDTLWQKQYEEKFNNPFNLKNYDKRNEVSNNKTIQ